MDTDFSFCPKPPTAISQLPAYNPPASLNISNPCHDDELGIDAPHFPAHTRASKHRTRVSTMSYLERAITDGHAKLTGEGKQQKILYVAVNHTERYADPEEQVRAEFWAELIYRNGYEPARIGVEITVPDRTPSDRADLVVFRDDERKKPYAVIECKADDRF